MIGFATNIEARARQNENFRQVLYTAPHSQLVVMTLRPGEDIGLERHERGDQFIRVESGRGEAVIDGKKYALADGVAVVIPAGAEHNVINTSASEPLRLYTLYSPPEHASGTVHKTKEDAERDTHDHPQPQV
ncbi:MAG TPA: cupin domain-containing protein [Polyangiaceae bacterium]|nr:cupin domain-containing protein [Polyangiaceae bacterium]